MMVTALYTTIICFLAIFLSLQVIKTRRRHRTALGAANSVELERKIRTQANCMEYSPLFLLALWMAESQAASIWLVHALGLVFLIGRLLHAYGVGWAEIHAEDGLKNVHYRVYGMYCTFFAIALAAFTLLWQSVEMFLLG